MYRNHKENFNRTTNRSARSLVKLFSIEEGCVQDDLAELQRRINRLTEAANLPGADDVPVQDTVMLETLQVVDGVQEVHGDDVPLQPGPSRVKVVGARVEVQKLLQVTVSEDGEQQVAQVNVEVGHLSLPMRTTTCCKMCCCLAHCQVRSHSKSVWKKPLDSTDPFGESSPSN